MKTWKYLATLLIKLLRRSINNFMIKFAKWLLQREGMFSDEDEDDAVWDNGSEHEDDIGWTDERTDTGGRFWGSAGAGVLPICTETGRILVQFRSGSVDQGHTWGTFGGALRGEHIQMMQQNEMGAFQAAAMEEFEEEIGTSVGKIQLVPAFQFQKGNFKYQNFLGLVGKEFRPRQTWEADGYDWLTYEELIELEPKHFGLKALLQNSGSLIQRYVKRKR